MDGKGRLIRRKKGAKRRRPTSTIAVPSSILGLDISSACVGWAYFQDGTPIAYGKYVPTGEHHGEKLSHFREWLTEQLKGYQPDALLIEAPFAGRRRFAFGVLMMYCGVALQSHFEYFGVEQPPEHRVPAHLIKKLLRARKTSSYEQRKKNMVLAMNQRYGLSLRFKANDRTKKVSDDDTADALALVTAFLIHHVPGFE